MTARDEPLVGRALAMCLLDELVGRAAAGESPVACITARPGLGRSSLVHAWVRRLTAAGATAHAVQVDPSSTLEQMVPTGALDAPLDDEATRDAASRLAARRHRTVQATAELASERRPLVLVYDDVHHAEPHVAATIGAIIEAQIRGLAIVVTATTIPPQWTPDTVVPTNAPWIPAAPELPHPGPRAIVLELEPLDRRDVARMLERAGAADSDARSVAALIHEATGGSPFEVRHCVSGLAALGHLGSTALDAGAVAGVIDDLVRLDDRLDSLDADHRLAAEAIALWRAPVAVERVAELLGWDHHRAASAIDALDEAGLLRRSDRQHVEIGVESLRVVGAADRVSPTVVDRVARALVAGDPEQRVRGAVLLGEIAGELSGSALDDAIEIWTSVGRDALDRSQPTTAAQLLGLAWHHGDRRSESSVGSAVALGAVEAAWLAGNRIEVEVIAKAARRRAHARVVDLELAYFQMRSRFDAQDFDGALDVALAALATAGSRLPERPTTAKLAIPFVRTAVALRRTDPAAVAALPAASDDDAIVHRMLAGLVEISYTARQNLYPFIVLEGVRRTLRDGISAFSPVALCGFAALQAINGNHDVARRWGLAAYELSRARPECRSAQPMTTMLYYDFVHHWHERSDHSLHALEDAVSDALALGDLNAAGLLHAVWLYSAFATGQTMQVIDASADAMLPELVNHPVVWRLTALTKELPRRLSGASDRYAGDDGRHHDELTVTADRLCAHAAAFFVGDYDRALTLARVAADSLAGVRGTSNLAGLRLTHALTLARADAPDAASALRRAQRDFRRWSKHAPLNYEPGLRLVEAELARGRGKYEAAMDLYLQAIRLGDANGQPIVAAMARTYAGSLEYEKGRAAAARGWLLEASAAWSERGCHAVAASLRDRFPLALGDRPAASRQRIRPSLHPLIDRALTDVAVHTDATAVSIVEQDTDVTVFEHRSNKSEGVLDITRTPLSDAMELRVHSVEPLRGGSDLLRRDPAVESLATLLRGTARPPDTASTDGVATIDGFLAGVVGDHAASLRSGEVVSTELFVLIADVRNYTGRIHDGDTAANAALMRRYFGVMSDAVRSSGGWMKPQEGDSIVAVFNDAPSSIAGAQAGLAALDRFNEKLDEAERVEVGVGITHGEVAIAVVDDGSSVLIVGDAVNLASRIESATRTLDRRILIDSSVVRRLGRANDRFERFPAFQVRNRPAAVWCYAPGDDLDDDVLAGRNDDALRVEIGGVSLADPPGDGLGGRSAGAAG